MSDSGKDVLKQMLRYDPDSRPNARRLLEHQHFHALRERDPSTHQSYWKKSNHNGTLVNRLNQSLSSPALKKRKTGNMTASAHHVSTSKEVSEKSNSSFSTLKKCLHNDIPVSMKHQIKNDKPYKFCKKVYQNKKNVFSVLCTKEVINESKQQHLVRRKKYTRQNKTGDYSSVYTTQQKFKTNICEIMKQSSSIKTDKSYVSLREKTEMFNTHRQIGKPSSLRRIPVLISSWLPRGKSTSLSLKKKVSRSSTRCEQQVQRKLVSQVSMLCSEMKQCSVSRKTRIAANRFMGKKFAREARFKRPLSKSKPAHCTFVNSLNTNSVEPTYKVASSLYKRKEVKHHDSTEVPTKLREKCRQGFRTRTRNVTHIPDSSYGHDSISYSYASSKFPRTRARNLKSQSSAVSNATYTRCNF